MATKTLYVGNIPYSFTESDLTKQFADHSGTNARIIPSRGFGFIDVDSDELSNAIATQDNKMVEGRALRVNEAQPRDDNRRSSGGYAGSSGNRSNYRN